MHNRKTRSSVTSGASEYGNRALSLSDKNVLLRAENLRLRRALRKLGDAFSFWKGMARRYQAERDLLQENLQEQAQVRRKA
jgi:hypothetical protein